MKLLINIYIFIYNTSLLPSCEEKALKIYFRSYQLRKVPVIRVLKLNTPFPVKHIHKPLLSVQFQYK